MRPIFYKLFMRRYSEKKGLPETLEDQQFLLKMPDDLSVPCRQVQDLIGAKIFSGEAIGIEIVTAIKQALRLPLPTDIGATIVICNAMRETIELYGYPSPEVILQKLAERRKRLEETLKTK